jgi:dienelactone hydrolase
LPAQRLAQTRPGALGALIYHGGVPVSEFGPSWPTDVALQLHLADHDVWSELDVAGQLAQDAKDSELFVYASSAHLVTDASLAEYDRAITALIIERTVHFLDRLG